MRLHVPMLVALCAVFVLGLSACGSDSSGPATDGDLDKESVAESEETAATDGDLDGESAVENEGGEDVPTGGDLDSEAATGGDLDSEAATNADAEETETPQDVLNADCHEMDTDQVLAFSSLHTAGEGILGNSTAILKVASDGSYTLTYNATSMYEEPDINRQGVLSDTERDALLAKLAAHLTDLGQDCLLYLPAINYEVDDAAYGHIDIAFRQGSALHTLKSDEYYPFGNSRHDPRVAVLHTMRDELEDAVRALIPCKAFGESCDPKAELCADSYKCLAPSAKSQASSAICTRRCLTGGEACPDGATCDSDGLCRPGSR